MYGNIIYFTKLHILPCKAKAWLQEHDIPYWSVHFSEHLTLDEIKSILK